MIDFQTILQILAQQRPIFHSEADFQHALAWELQKRYPEAIIRLEYPIVTHDATMYLDILFALPDNSFAIELKYKTRGLTCAVNGEPFHLRSHSAQDIGRYEVIKDIYRLETIQKVRQNTRGYLIFLTNDSSYWTAGRGGTIYEDFRLNEGHLLSGTVMWGDRASAGTRKGRELPIPIAGSYKLRWLDYSSVNAAHYQQFRYMLVETV